MGEFICLHLPKGDPAPIAVASRLERFIRTVFDKAGVIYPTMLACTPEGDVLVLLGQDLGGHQLDGAAQFLAERWAVSYAVAFEAWMAAYDQHTSTAGSGFVAPSKRTDRCEVITIGASDGLDRVLRNFEIERPMDGSPARMSASPMAGFDDPQAMHGGPFELLDGDPHSP